MLIVTKRGWSVQRTFETTVRQLRYLGHADGQTQSDVIEYLQHDKYPNNLGRDAHAKLAKDSRPPKNADRR